MGFIGRAQTWVRSYTARERVDGMTVLRPYRVATHSPYYLAAFNKRAVQKGLTIRSCITTARIFFLFFRWELGISAPGFKALEQRLVQQTLTL